MLNRIEGFVFKVWVVLLELYGSDAADRELYPLLYYINSGRATTPFLKAMINSDPIKVAKKLHIGGSDRAVMNRIKKYLRVETF